MGNPFFPSSSQGDDHVPTSSSLSRLRQEWIQEQILLKSKLILEDDFLWSVPEPDATGGSNSSTSTTTTTTLLRYVGGVDISFSKDDPSVACAALVVVDLRRDLQVVYEDYSAPVHLDVPYVPGFLAFREAPLLVGLLEAMKKRDGDHPFYPQLLMVDGNGLLHPRGNEIKSMLFKTHLHFYWSSDFTGFMH